MEPSYNSENPTKKELWGVKGKNAWTYQPKGAITGIKIRWGWYIDSVSFKSNDGDGSWKKYGGNGGTDEPSFQIDWPNDYLESISGTYDSTAINTLGFKTHKGKQYGPFGRKSDKEEKKFELSAKDSIIVGLYGHESNLLDAIGVYVKPYAGVFVVPSRVLISREERNVQPVQFLLTVDSYSLLPTNQGEKFHSEYFDYGGFTWKLILYPNGDKNPEGKGYISFYLAIHENAFNSRGENFTVSVDLRFFVLNKFTNKYLTIRDAKGAVMKFRKLTPIQGFSQLISLDTFKNPSNGYLVDDACAFGAEFLIIEPSSRARQETLTLIKNPEGIARTGDLFKDSLGQTFTWNIRNFSTLLAGNSLRDARIDVKARPWFLHMYPKGRDSPKGKFLSLFLIMYDASRKVYVKGKLRVINHSGNKSKEITISRWFNELNTELGTPEFIPLSELLLPSNEYLKDDTLRVQIEFEIVSEYKTQ